jgi:hypothetical protein
MHVAVWMSALMLVGFNAQDQGAKTSPDKSPATRPASSTSPSTASAPSATPRDAEVLKELIREVERQPVTPAKGARSAVPSSAPSETKDPRGKDEPFVHDGGAVVERTGRLTRVGQVIEFRFTRDDGKGTAAFQLQPNVLLEQIERDVDAGATQAVLSGEVQRYKGRTFLLTRTYRRAAQRGNLSP